MSKISHPTSCTTQYKKSSKETNVFSTPPDAGASIIKCTEILFSLTKAS